MGSLKRLASNFGFTLGGHFIEALLALLVLGISARYLKPERFGIFAFALAFVQMFYFLADVGLVRLLVREIARHREEAARYLGAAIISRIFFILVIVPLLVISINLISSSRETHVAVYITTVWMVIRLFCTAYVGLFQAFEKMEFDSSLAVLAALARLGFTYWAIRLDAGLTGILIAMVASQMVHLLAAMLIGRVRFCQPEFKKDIALWKFLIIQSLPIGASGFFSTTYHQMNTLFLTGFRTTLEVGLYNGPYRIIRELLLLPLLLMKAPFPIISRLYHFAPNSLPVVVGQLFKLSLAVGMPLGVAIALLADEIMLFILGSQFSDGAYVLRYFSGVVAMMFPALFAATLLLAMDRQNLVAFLAGGCVCVNALLNLFFVPIMGGVGACLATLLATAGMFVAFTVYVLKYVPDLSFRQIVLEPCLATLGLFFILVLLRPYGLVLTLLAGFLLYAGMMLALVFLFSKWNLKAFRESIRQV